jgi:lipoate-protein ligase A
MSADPIRILDTGLKSARWNVAMAAALAQLHGNGAAPDTLRFHRYQTCVLLGRNQEAESAADVDYCRRHGIDIVRRVTGGGAVFMSPRTLAWDMLVHRRRFGGDLGALTRGICNGIAAGLSRLGCAARYRPPNDIEIDGRKVSGSSGYSAGRSALLQGTVLVADEAEVIARALRVPEAALRASVTCLAEAVGAVPPLASIVECISLGLAEALRRRPVCSHPSADEMACCDVLLQESIAAEPRLSGLAAPTRRVAG